MNNLANIKNKFWKISKRVIVWLMKILSVMGVLIVAFYIAIVIFYHIHKMEKSPFVLRIIDDKQVSVETCVRMMDGALIENEVPIEVLEYVIRDRNCVKYVPHIIISGGEMLEHKVIDNVFYESFAGGIWDIMFSYKGELIPISATDYSCLYQPWKEDRSVQIKITKSVIEIDGCEVQPSELDYNLNIQTEQGRRPLQIFCAKDSKHLDLLEVLYAYHVIGGDIVFVGELGR